MQKKTPKAERVQKPYITGSFAGKDARKLGFRRIVGMLGVSLLYFLGSVIVTFDSLAGRLIPAIVIVGAVLYYQYTRGLAQGTADVAFGEMMWSRQEEGRPIDAPDRERCFHPLKGFFVALIGAVPYVALAVVFACLTKPVVYSLGALPSWTSDMRSQSEFGQALSYYEQNASLSVVEILRIAVRAMTMPMISVATLLGNQAAFVAERLSPLFVLLAPAAYGLGYLGGPEQRVLINTGIKLGDDKKRKKERKARKQRQRSRTPERLI